MKFLRVLAHSDIFWLRFYRNQPELMKWFRQTRQLTEEDQEKWFKSLNPIDAHFVIVNDLSCIGYCYLKHVDFIHRSAEFGIFTVGKTNIGLFALKELINFGFNNLGLNRIYSDVLEGNPALKLYLLLGFEKEGVIRQAYFKHGRFINSNIIGLLKEDWDARLCSRLKGVNREKAFRNIETVGA